MLLKGKQETKASLPAVQMAILTRQDADSAEEEAEEEGWSQSSWSTCSGDDAASKGAEKSAPGGLSACLAAAESDRCYRLV